MVDLRIIDPMGVVEIRDRIKDVIKTGGEWISSLELESLISEHPAVSSVAVVGVPDPQWGERPVALVVSEGITAERLVADIPKTSIGKINKRLIREQALSQ